MKVRLLNDGTYDELSHIEFPVEVEAELDGCRQLFNIPWAELVRIGAKDSGVDYGSLPFYVDTECELIEN
ncbi:MAG: hypothetical protein ACRC3K_07920 [Plesiomonas sp.]